MGQGIAGGAASLLCWRHGLVNPSDSKSVDRRDSGQNVNPVHTSVVFSDHSEAVGQGVASGAASLLCWRHGLVNPSDSTMYSRSGAEGGGSQVNPVHTSIVFCDHSTAVGQGVACGAASLCRRHGLVVPSV